jgi:hypothetical protein
MASGYEPWPVFKPTPVSQSNCKLWWAVRLRLFWPVGSARQVRKPLLNLAIVGVHVKVKGVDVAVFKVANNNLVVERHLAVAAMPGKRAVNKAGPLVPGLGGGVVHPSGVGRGEDQHVKAVAILLISVRNGVRHVAVLLDLPLDRMG